MGIGDISLILEALDDLEPLIKKLFKKFKKMAPTVEPEYKKFIRYLSDLKISEVEHIKDKLNCSTQTAIDLINANIIDIKKS